MIARVSAPLHRSPGLDKNECVQLLHHLDGCLALFERRIGTLSAPEIRIKSMVSAMRNEVLHQIRSFEPGTPPDGKL
jgi:hypothetical protein